MLIDVATRKAAIQVVGQITGQPSTQSAAISAGPYPEVLVSREDHADVESLRHLLAPASVAVIGAGRRPGSVGRAIFHNIVASGYPGRVYPVNPRARHIEGVHCVSSVAGLPEPVDLAVVAVPPEAVADVAEQCGLRGVRGLVVVTAGLDTGQGADLLAACRRHGMRLIGPNCFGIAVPGIGLNATFWACRPEPGVAGLVMQSGGLGVSLAERLSQLGVGISSFASLGTKYDVSANDMLMWWAQDQVTRLAILCVDSFGNPRKFARAARRLGQRMPVLVLDTGQSGPGQQPASCDGAAIPQASRTALAEQAGIIGTASHAELLDTVAVLATQPVPAGQRVAIVSNVGEAAALAVAACAEAGLAVHAVTAGTRRRLRAVVPHGGVVTGPVDTTPTLSAAAFRHCVELLAADAGVDAVIAVALPTAATGDLAKSICEAQVGVPLVAVLLDQPEGVRLLHRERAGDTAAVPAYGDPGDAARALGHAAAYGVWRARASGSPPQLPGLATENARALVHQHLQQMPAGGWLAPAQAAELLGCYGITLQPRAADDAQVAAGTVQDPVFGPLVFLGPAGTASGAADGQAVRLAPLTDTDAAELIGDAAPALLIPGDTGSHEAGLAALRDILLRASHLAGDLPELAELQLGPIAVGAERTSAAAARIRLVPCPATGPFLRKLR